MLTKIIKIALFLFITTTVMSQPLELDFSSTSTVVQGGTYDVEVRVNNFDELLSAQLGIFWDSTVMRIDTIPFVSTALPDFNRQSVSIPADNQTVVRGVAKLSWTSLSLIPQSIPDNTLLFTMRFNIVGDPCDFTTFTIGDPTPPFLLIEVIHNDKDEIGAVGNGFTVMVPGTNCVDPPTPSGCVDGDIELVFQDATIDNGANVCIPMTVTNFTDVSTFQMSASWDPAILTYTGVQNFVLPGTSPNSFNVNDANGTVTYVWFDNSTANPQTLNDGSTLFELCFDAIGAGSSILQAQETPTIIQVSNSNGDILPTCITEGTITVSGDPPPPPTNCMDGDIELLFMDASGANNDNICVPMTVTNFIDVSTFQMSASWDPAVLTYTGVQNFVLPGTSPNSFNVNNANGTVTYVWFDNSTANPQSFADGATLFELCFDLIGADGETTSLEAQDTPTLIQVSNSNGDILPTCSTAGTVAVSGGPPPPQGTFTLVSQNITTSELTTCVDISVRGFTDIVTAQFAVQWDDSAICFSELTNLNQTLPLFESFFNQVEDVLRFSWNNPDPISLPDGTVLFTICYDVKDVDCGTVVPVAFVGDPVPIEIAASGPNGDAVIPFQLDEGAVTINRNCTTGPFTVEEIITNVSCNNGSDGSINLVFTGGMAPFTCVWGPPINTTTTSNSNCQQSGLRAATYSVTITDNTGTSVTRTPVVSQPSPIVINGSTTPDNGSGGSISFNVTGGTPPYTELFNPPITNLNSVPQGTYTLLVTDANQCQQTNVFTVGTADVDIIIDGIFAASCGPDGRICITCTGGTGTYQLPTASPPLTFDPNQGCFVNVPGGTYVVRCTDSNGTVGERTVIVSMAPPTPLNCQVTDIVPAVCNGGGSFDINCSGGCPPYDIRVGLEGGAKELFDPNRAYIPGDYVVCITDAIGAEINIRFNIPVIGDGPLQTSIEVNTVAICSTNGVVTTTVTGGCNPTCLVVNNNTGETFACSNGSIISLPAGNYTLTAEDSSGSIDSASFVVESQAPPLVISPNNITPAPCSNFDGSVSLNISGGCGNTTCTIDIGNTGTFQQCEIVGGAISAPVGTHTITILDDATGLTESIIVTIPVSADALSVSLTGQTDNSVDITVGGGTAPFQFLWTFPDGSMTNTEDLTGLTMSGIYSLVVVDAMGCSVGFETNVNIVDPPAIILNIDTNSIIGSSCGSSMDCDGEIIGTVLNGIAPYNITISDQDGNSQTFQVAQDGGFLLSNICGGNYTVSVSDSDGATANFGNTVDVPAPDAIIISEDSIDCSDTDASNGSVSVFVDGGSGGFEYIWSPVLPNAGPSNDNLSPGTYSLTVTDINGCSSTIDLVVEDCSGGSGPIPTGCGEGLSVMTPNGDGRNDNLIITCADMQNNTLAIFDRYGREVFSQVNYRNDWNGVDLDGQELQEGAYHWVYIVDRQVIKGTITLLRG